MYFQMWCDADGCGLEYSSPDDARSPEQLGHFEQAVAGILSRRRRLPWFRASKIALGRDPKTSWWRLLSWKGIMVNLVVAVVGGLIVGLAMLLITNIG